MKQTLQEQHVMMVMLAQMMIRSMINVNVNEHLKSLLTVK